MEFVQIFSEMSMLSMILLIVGALFFVVEVFLPGFGFFGVTGVGSIIAGVVVRICQGLNLTQALTLILITVGFFAIAMMFIVFSAKYGILGKTGLFENSSALSKDYNKVEKQLKKLVGKSGKTVSNLDLAGQAKIAGKIYDVVSISSYIEKGKNIKVVEIKNNAIMVRKWFE